MNFIVSFWNSNWKFTAMEAVSHKSVSFIYFCFPNTHSQQTLRQRINWNIYRIVKTKLSHGLHSANSADSLSHVIQHGNGQAFWFLVRIFIAWKNKMIGWWERKQKLYWKIIKWNPFLFFWCVMNFKSMCCAPLNKSRYINLAPIRNL